MRIERNSGIPLLPKDPSDFIVIEGIEFGGPSVRIGSIQASVSVTLAFKTGLAVGFVAALGLFLLFLGWVH